MNTRDYYFIRLTTPIIIIFYVEEIGMSKYLSFPETNL